MFEIIKYNRYNHRNRFHKPRRGSVFCTTNLGLLIFADDEAIVTASMVQSPLLLEMFTKTMLESTYRLYLPYFDVVSNEWWLVIVNFETATAEVCTPDVIEHIRTPMQEQERVGRCQRYLRLLLLVIEHFSQVHGLIAPAAVADRPATALTQAGADDVAEPEETTFLFQKEAWQNSLQLPVIPRYSSFPADSKLNAISTSADSGMFVCITAEADYFDIRLSFSADDIDMLRLNLSYCVLNGQLPFEV